MDAIDRKILAELEADGRLTVTTLAQRVSLSVSPCHRRLRELERAGAIREYRAVIDPAAIGLGFRKIHRDYAVVAFPLGSIFTAIGHAHLAPTPAHLSRDQRVLREADAIAPLSRPSLSCHRGEHQEPRGGARDRPSSVRMQLRAVGTLSG